MFLLTRSRGFSESLPIYASTASGCIAFGAVDLQDSGIDQVLSLVEDAVLMLQGTAYMLADKGALLQARRRRLPPSARVIGHCLFVIMQSLCATWPCAAVMPALCESICPHMSQVKQSC